MILIQISCLQLAVLMMVVVNTAQALACRKHVHYLGRTILKVLNTEAILRFFMRHSVKP